MAAHALPQPIAVFHEHPHWFAPLFAELERRGLPYDRIDAASHSFDPAERSVPYSLVLNRASPSAYLRGHAQSLFYTLHWLRHLDLLGVPVVNGADVYGLELSKALQLDLLEELGLPYPRARVINHPAQVPVVAAGLRAPLLVKANVGGSGAGIVRYETAAALAEAVAQDRVALGVDGTALVQECAPLRDGHITRVETLGGSYLYAINVYPASGSFDLCPADACQTIEGVELVRGACAVDAPRTGLRVEAARPPAEIIAQVEHITRVETLGGSYLYAINVYPASGSFDLCPADACQTIEGVELVRGACAVDAPRTGLRVEAARPPAEIIAQVEHIARAARLDVGGIEYLVDDRDGRHYFYDINALSNFVADAPNVIGFDPWVPLVDYLEQRAGLAHAKVA